MLVLTIVSSTLRPHRPASCAAGVTYNCQTHCSMADRDGRFEHRAPIIYDPKTGRCPLGCVAWCCTLCFVHALLCSIHSLRCACKVTCPNVSTRMHRLHVHACAAELRLAPGHPPHRLTCPLLLPSLTGAFTERDSLAKAVRPRLYHSSAVLLPSCQVMVSGSDVTGDTTAEVYSPVSLCSGAAHLHCWGAADWTAEANASVAAPVSARLLVLPASLALQQLYTTAQTRDLCTCQPCRPVCSPIHVPPQLSSPLCSPTCSAAPAPSSPAAAMPLCRARP